MLPPAPSAANAIGITPSASAAALRNPTSLGRMLELAMADARADRLKNGVPLPEALLAALNQLAGELRITPIG